jgi:AcrR family transcriptional regulator
VGLRESKKRQTKTRIAEAAYELFASRGYDAVSVAAVARHAEVSEATVFNYFERKEDLVFLGLDRFEAVLIESISARTPGTSVVTAFGAYLTGAASLLGSDRPADAARLATVNRLIAESPALRARERDAFDAAARALAALIAGETGAKPDDIRATVTATALIGLQRALVEYVRAELLAGRSVSLAGIRARTRTGIDLLRRGLG